MFNDNEYIYKKAIRTKASRALGSTIALDMFFEFIGFWDAREYENANEIRTEAKDLQQYQAVSFMNQYTDL